MLVPANFIKLGGGGGRRRTIIAPHVFSFRCFYCPSLVLTKNSTRSGSLSEQCMNGNIFYFSSCHVKNQSKLQFCGEPGRFCGEPIHYWSSEGGERNEDIELVMPGAGHHSPPTTTIMALWGGHRA